MKNMRFNSMMMGGILLLGMYGCTPKMQDYSSYVNPFIGTGGHGHTYPGAIVWQKQLLLKFAKLTVLNN